MLRFILALLLLALAGTCFAQGNDIAPPQNDAAPVATPTAVSQPTDIDRLRAELELERENAVLQARNELSSQAYSRLENYIGAFGIIIAVVGLVFGLSTREAAVAKAKEGVEAIRREMEKLRNDTRQLAAEGRTHVEGMRNDRGELRRILEENRSGTTPETSEDRNTINDAAKGASAKPPSERTIDDLKALTLASFIDQNWSAMRDHSQALLYLHGTNNPAASFALFNLAFALGKLERSEEAITFYDALIARFDQSTEPELQETVASALYNKGVRLSVLGKADEAVAVYDDVIARFQEGTRHALRVNVAKSLINKGAQLVVLKRFDDAIAAYDYLLARFDDSPEPELRKQVANAMFGKGIRLRALGRVEDAIAIYDSLVARFGDSTEVGLLDPVAKSLVNMGSLLASTIGDTGRAIAICDNLISRFADSTEPVLREQAEMAMFNKACALALSGNTPETIGTLQHWRDYLGHFDCERVLKDADFDTVRTDPAFTAFLTEMGCTPKPKRAPAKRKPKAPK